MSIGYFYPIKILNGTFQSFAWAVNFALLSNWFPKKGRGFLLGLWATNPSVGDIVGQQLYLAFVRDNVNHWGYTFITLGVFVEIVALMNLFFLIEYPMDAGVEIKEKGTLLRPDVTSA